MLPDGHEHLQSFTAQPLAIHEEWVALAWSGALHPRTLSPAIQALADSGDFLGAEMAARGPVRSNGGTAVINLMGPLQQHADMFTLLFGGTSYEGFKSQLSQALSDDAIKSIVLNVDSPGGTAEGMTETAQALFEARGRKPITAVANTMMASAAYGIGSQADEVVLTPSSWVGSIGVVMVHMDMSAALEQAGIKPTIVRSGKYKLEGNPLEPLSEEALAHTQSLADEWYGQFVSAVARGRGVSESEVRNGMGQGRMEVGQRAVRAGLADRVATLDQVLGRHGGGSTRAARSEEPVNREALARLYEIALIR